MVPRGYRTLVLWVAWSVVAIVIYAGMYHDTEVWEFVHKDPTRVTWAILGLFGVGVVTSFLLTWLITKETLSIDKLEIIAKRSGWLGIDYAKKNLCVANFFDSLKTVVDNNGDINVEALVEVEFAMYQRTAHALEVIGNLLITLGLVGTVVGLTLTLTGLTSSLDALGHDQEQLLRGLRGAMGGMGTAFYTTLLGSVLGGVLLRVFAQINQNGVEGLENALTRICLVHCSADFKPSTERDIRTLNAEIEKLSTNISHLQQNMNEAKRIVADFNVEMSNLRVIEEQQHESINKTLITRQKYLNSLRDEFQLKRMNRGSWLKVFIKSFYKQ
jgi:flagellar biosynthesis chaperone FliJ